MDATAQASAPETQVAQTEELLALAARTPLTRQAVTRLAARLDEATARAGLAEAVEQLDEHLLLVLLSASCVAGYPPTMDEVAEAIPFLQNAELILALIGSCPDDPLDGLLRLAENQEFSDDRHALVLFAAAESLGCRDAPKELLTLIRQHARRPLSVQAGSLLGFAATRSGDREVLEVAGDWTRIVRTQAGRRLHDSLLTLLNTPPAELLPNESERPPEQPVKHLGPKPGRNSPCPCGSGRKFKKCCSQRGLDSDEARHLAAAVARNARSKGSTPLLAHRLETDESFATLQPHQIARLDAAQLSSSQLVIALRKYIGSRMWEEAQGILRLLEDRDDTPEPATSYRFELVHDALLGGELELARTLAAASSVPLPTHLRTALEVAEPSGEALAILDAAAREGLENPERPEVFDLAHTLLDHYPALGILVGRGVLDPGHALDSMAILDAIELARDRLLLAPNDPGQNLYDLLAAEQLDERMTVIAARHQEEARDLGRRAEEARTRLRQLERELKQRTQELQHFDLEPSPEGPSDETDRLRRKVEEMKDLIESGNRHRRKLREEIGRLNIRNRDEEQATTPTPDEAEVEEAGVPLDEEEARRRPLLELCGLDALDKALREVPRAVARKALVQLAELAAGDESAWRQVKRLQLTTPLFSARVGIHHRLLFEIGDGRLRAREFVPRERLDTVLKRYD